MLNLLSKKPQNYSPLCTKSLIRVPAVLNSSQNFAPILQLVKVITNNGSDHSKRFLQTKIPLHVGFFDDVAGTYRTLQNPPDFSKSFKMNMKPWEFRNGQPFWYFNFGGILIISFSLGVAFLFLFYYTFWYFYASPQVTAFNHSFNPHPFLEIRNGRDLAKTYDPLSKLFVYWSPYRAEDKKIMYYRELNLAKNHKL